MKKDPELIKLCRHLWEAMETFRRRRRTCLDYAFGRHWNIEYTLPDGRVTTMEREMRANGKTPVTNNLTRQLIKTVVGKWRYLNSRHDCEGDDSEHTVSRALDTTPGRLTDARGLEEFLISGCAAQMVDGAGAGDNISPARLILAPFLREDAADCRLMGVLHDMTPAEIVRRFSGGDRRRYLALVEAIHGHRSAETALFAERERMQFDKATRGGTIRVVEVWQRRPVSLMRLHDMETASYLVAECCDETRRRVDRLNAARGEAGRQGVAAYPDVADIWVHSILLPDGTLLGRESMPEGNVPPLVVRCYPMIDGEIHSLVEDVQSQQEYINRLIMMLDDTLCHAAKGVLLYPSDQLPSGMTWEQLRHLWSRPGAIIPFIRNSKNITPEQISNSGTIAGAADMLRTQLDLFGRISGTSFATERHGINANSADMLRRQMENEMVSLLDILASYQAFLSRRDEVAAMISGKGVEYV